jgi:heat shock protein HslJ
MYKFNDLLKTNYNMKTTKLFLLVLIMSICVVSLKAQKPTVEGEWKIKSYKDAGKMIDASAKETNVTINTKAKTIHVHAGCNKLNANFEFITSDKIKPFQVVSTRKSCNGEAEVMETAVRYILEQTNSVRKNGAKIEFYKDNELLIVLERPVDNGKKKR